MVPLWGRLSPAPPVQAQAARRRAGLLAPLADLFKLQENFSGSYHGDWILEKLILLTEWWGEKLGKNMLKPTLRRRLSWLKFFKKEKG